MHGHLLVLDAWGALPPLTRQTDPRRKSLLPLALERRTGNAEGQCFGANRSLPPNVSSHPVRRCTSSLPPCISTLSERTDSNAAPGTTVGSLGARWSDVRPSPWAALPPAPAASPRSLAGPGADHHDRDARCRDVHPCRAKARRRLRLPRFRGDVQGRDAYITGRLDRRKVQIRLGRSLAVGHERASTARELEHRRRRACARHVGCGVRRRRPPRRQPRARGRRPPGEGDGVPRWKRSVSLRITGRLRSDACTASERLVSI